MSLDNKSLIDLIKDVPAWNLHRKENPNEVISLEEENLSDLNLTGINLNDANLRKVDFSNSILDDATFVGANLNMSILKHAKLASADLTACDLSGTTLNRANLELANITDSILENSNLDDANLEGANLTRVNLYNAKIRNSTLHNSILYGAILENTDCTKTTFEKSDLRRAVLRYANLTSANLQDTLLDEANMTGANLVGADLRNSDLTKANLLDADLERANLLNSKVSGLNLQNANLDNAIYDPEILTQAIGIGVKYLVKTRLSDRKRKLEDEIEQREQLIQKIKGELSSKHISENPALEEKVVDNERVIHDLKQLLKEEEDRRKELEGTIDQALEKFETPNSYITKEIEKANCHYWSFIILAYASGLAFIAYISYLGFKGVPISDIDNLYKFLIVVSPSLISLSLMSYFFRSVFKRREEVKDLEEKRRQIETIKGSLQAYNLFNDDEDTREVMRDTILKLRDANVSAFSSSHGSPNPKIDEDIDYKSIVDIIVKTLKISK